MERPQKLDGTKIVLSLLQQKGSSSLGAETNSFLRLDGEFGAAWGRGVAVCAAPGDAHFHPRDLPDSFAVIGASKNSPSSRLKCGMSSPTLAVLDRGVEQPGSSSGS